MMTTNTVNLQFSQCLFVFHTCYARGHFFNNTVNNHEMPKAP